MSLFSGFLLTQKENYFPPAVSRPEPAQQVQQAVQISNADSDSNLLGSLSVLMVHHARLEERLLACANPLQLSSISGSPGGARCFAIYSPSLLTAVSRVFTKLTKPVPKALPQQDVKKTMYLDI